MSCALRRGAELRHGGVPGGRVVRARAYARGAAATARRSGGDRAVHQPATARSSSRLAAAGVARSCRVPTSTGAAAWQSWSPTSTRQRIDEIRATAVRLPALRGARADCAAAGDHARLRRHHHPSSGGRGVVHRGPEPPRGVPRHARRRDACRMRPIGSSCACCAAARLRGVHAPRRACPQEHPRLRTDRLGQDHLDQGLIREIPSDERLMTHRGCA